MAMRFALLSLAFLTAALLAGCSDNGPAPPAEDAGFEDLGLQATEETGVIRGVVIDAAITPISGVAVSVRSGDVEPLSATTNEAGAFGFDGLAPGTWFITASKPGYFDAQQSVEVVADVADPPAVKILLEANEAARPYYEQYVFEGFMECGVTTPAVGVALCLAPNLVAELACDEFDVCVGNTTNENSQVHYEVTRLPQWAQSEMVWDSTQALGNELALMYSWSGDCGLLCDHDVRGESPLVLRANETVLQTIGFGGNNTDLYVRVFTDDNDATRPPQDTICWPDVPGVIGAGCLNSGDGVTLEQSFTIYTHVFYGYLPPEGWTFIESGSPPAPPA